MSLNQNIIKNHYGIISSDPAENHESLKNKKFYQLGEGILICFDSFKSNPFMEVPFFKKRIPIVEFVYFLCGDAFFLVENPTGSKSKVDLKTGMCTAIYNSQIYGKCVVNEVTDVKCLYIYFTPEKIISLCGEKGQMILHKLLSRVTKAEGYEESRRMIPPVETLVYEIFNCRLNEPSKNIFIKGKVLELLAYEIESLDKDRNQNIGFSTDDIRQLELARDIMMENMVSPPSMEELSRLVGLNQKKIKAGFQAIYNTTVFGFLRSYRMEQARLMLERDTISVTQAGSAVGYTNISHFSAAFRTRFGIRPGDYLKSRRLRFHSDS